MRYIYIYTKKSDYIQHIWVCMLKHLHTYYINTHSLSFLSHTLSIIHAHAHAHAHMCILYTSCRFAATQIDQHVE